MPDHVGHVFVSHSTIIICRLHKYTTLTEQTQVTLQLAVGLSDLASRFLAGLPFAGARIFGCPSGGRYI